MYAVQRVLNIHISSIPFALCGLCINVKTQLLVICFELSQVVRRSSFVGKLWILRLPDFLIPPVDENSLLTGAIDGPVPAKPVPPGLDHPGRLG